MSLILKPFIDVLTLHGTYEYRISEAEIVPNAILELWRRRGYNPASVGVAHVKFNFSGKEYMYPAVFWSE